VRVCNPSLCGGERCCNLGQAPVCATDDECNEVLDFCDVQDEDSCPRGAQCCPTSGGLRCVNGERCPDPENPLAGTCLFETFECFGEPGSLQACVNYEEIEMVDAEYEDSSRVTFFETAGEEARRASKGGVDCFETIDSNQQISINNLFNGEQFQIVREDGLLRIQCPDDTVQVVPSTSLSAFLPEAPAADICALPAQGGCSADAECQQLDPSLLCCSKGDTNECLTPEGCFLNTPRQACSGDGQCGDGQRCCELSPVRVCDPTLCGGELCCNIAQAPVCASVLECEAVFDFCDANDTQTCPQDQQCCPTSGGLRCVSGEQCPEPDNPLLGSCLFDTFECFGQADALQSCVDRGELGIIEAAYEDSARVSFFEFAGSPARRASKAAVDCFEVIERNDVLSVSDLIQGENYELTLDGEFVRIQCPDDSVEVINRSAISGFLPEAPDGGSCEDPQRPLACQSDNDCLQIDGDLVCCDRGDDTQCLTNEGCFYNTPRPACSNDNECGQGTRCCELSPVRVCNPSLCDGELCCNLGTAPVCATDAECDSVFDFCDPNELDACPGGELCCPTTGGRRCISGEQCPEPANPLTATCILDTFECFGQVESFSACIDYGELGLVEAFYDQDALVSHYTLFGQTASRANRGGVDCFEVVEDGDSLSVNDLVAGDQFQISFEGDFARIACPDDTTQLVRRDGLEGFLPTAPDAQSCDEPQRNLGCTNNVDCADIDASLLCCDRGDETQCLTSEGCFINKPRTACTADDQCGEGSLCCELAPVRVCNPSLCDGELCCNLGSAGVCASQAECLGVQDFCDPENEASCPSGQQCCATADGQRCTAGDSCPLAENPLAGTCLEGVLGCFGKVNDLDSCIDRSNLGVILASYDGDQEVSHYSLGGFPARRASVGVVDCFETVDQGEVLVVNDLDSDESYQILLNGDTSQVICPNGDLDVVRTDGLNLFLAEVPDPQTCDEPQRNDDCQSNSECEDIDDTLLCCDTGESNQCLTSQGCFINEPRPVCSADDQCAEGTRCCEIAPVRVCNPSLCNGELCCNLNQAPVCATDAECESFFDFCAQDDPDSCPQGQQCCASANGLRCVEGDACPDPDNPFANTCLFNTFDCFGEVDELQACTNNSNINITESTYDDDAQVIHYRSRGKDAQLSRRGEVDCFEITQGGQGLLVSDLVGGDVFPVSFDGDFARIQCPDDSVNVVRRDTFNQVVLPVPDTDLCEDAVVAGCSDNAECAAIDENLVCCDRGDERQCLTAEGCFSNVPRRACDSDDQCFGDETCCGFETVRVCDPGLCEGQLCCNLEQQLACGTANECGSSLDFCQLDDPGTCPGNSLCCQTDDGNRCLETDTCPSLSDPVQQTCLGATLQCSGKAFDVLDCRDVNRTGIRRTTYSDGVGASFFDRQGQSVIVTTLEDDECFEVLDGEAGRTIRDLSNDSRFEIVIDGAEATITCPDETQEVVPTEAIEAYFPTRPSDETCPQDNSADQCQVDAECQNIDPSLVCCAEGDAKRCNLVSTCRDLSPVALCGDSQECGEGLECCGGQSARVCDPGLCDGSDCCTIQEAAVCEETPGECVLGSSCIAETLACSGEVSDLVSCENYESLGILTAQYATDARASFFDRAGANSVFTQEFFASCYLASATSETGLRVEDFVTGDVYELDTVDGGVLITCPDNSQETVTQASLDRFIPDVPAADFCGVPTRDDQCSLDNECVEAFGDEAVCCDSGNQNICGATSECEFERPRTLCETSETCGEGEGCCNLNGFFRVCDPAQCEFDVCCFVESPKACDASCLE
jgi:hypothetical protein